MEEGVYAYHIEYKMMTMMLLMVDKSDCGHQTLNTSGQIHNMAKVPWARMKYFYGAFKLCILFSKNVSILSFMADS